MRYAVVLGEVEGWVRRFTDVDTAADGAPGIYWYETDTPAEFPQRILAFLVTLDGVMS